jgi:phosphoenolpyruvate-protein kinase (PTS system EI component)
MKDDLQDMLSQTKQAQLENRLKDVAVLEEQMHLMLWRWKAELQAVPASSLLVCPSLTFSSPVAHISEIVSARLHSN